MQTIIKILKNRLISPVRHNIRTPSIANIHLRVTTYCINAHYKHSPSTTAGTYRTYPPSFLTFFADGLSLSNGVDSTSIEKVHIAQMNI